MSACRLLHRAYLGVALGMRVPAPAFWLAVLILVWLWLLRQGGDEWNFKRLSFFFALPTLILVFNESSLAALWEGGSLLLLLTRPLAERYRILPTQCNSGVESASPPLFSISRAVRYALIIVASAATALHSLPAWAVTYYVDSARGDDSFSGNLPDHPWKSLARVDHYQFHPGDIVRLARGSVWRETLEPQASSDSNFAGLTLATYGEGAPPTINGSDVIGKWTRWRGSIYSAGEVHTVYNVFVDQGPGWGLKRACCLSAAACDVKVVPPCQIGAMIPGSWYWSGGSTTSRAPSSVLYLWLYNSDSPREHLIEAVARELGIFGYVLSDQLNNLSIDGLRIIQTGHRGISLQSGDASGCCGSRGVGTGVGISGLSIRNSTVLRTGTGRADDGNYGNAITIINSTDAIIADNMVSYCGNHGNCIQVQNSNGARVLRNRVDHWNHNGVDIKGSRSVLVSANIGRDEPDDGAAFYTEYSSDVIFRDNTAVNVSNGFQISVGASATVEQNSMTNAKTALYFGPRANSVGIYDNVAIGCIAAVGSDGTGRLQQRDNMWGCVR